MPDESRDPVQSAQLRALEARLQELASREEATINALAGSEKRLEGAVGEVEAGARRLAGGEAIGATEPAVIREGVTATDALAAAQARATAAAEARLAVEQREVQVTAEVAAAQGRYRSAIGSQAAADAEQAAARRTYTGSLGARSGATAEQQAAYLQQAEQAKQAAGVARQETAAARTNLEARQAELQALRGDVTAAKEAARATQAEAGEAAQRVALGAELTAAMRARLESLGGAGGLPPGGGRPPAPPGGEPPFGGYGGRQPPAYGIQAAAAAATAAPRPAPTGTVRLQEVSDLSERQNKLAQSAQTAASRELNLGSAMEYSARQMSLSSLQYQRHGALTTEFIRAAAKGQVTVRDLGTEIGLTVAKFGGWTAAAALTYGGLKALNDVKQGAVDAASGVQALTRFLPDLNRGQAFQQLGQQASELNVPIKDVTETASSFARIFKNQNDVITASHVALLATKLDNIDLADSYRYLTALTQEYGLRANQLPGVFDQISSAQRALGARVSETLPALARSAAAVKNAGGDINQLLAELSLTIVRTGQTGASVGTAFYRGASRFFYKPTNQELLRTVGIDPSQGFTGALAQAISKQGLSGGQRRDVAQAIFGPQFGGRFASIIGAGPETLNRFLRDTSPEASKGAAQKELGHVLDQANEKIKAVSVQLQVLGSELAQTGALKPLGALVTGFDDVLKIINLVLGAVNDLPLGLGHALVPLAEIVAALKVAQRFNLGSILPGRGGQGIGGFLAQPGRLGPTTERAQRTDITKGIDEQRGYYQELVSNTTRANARLRANIVAQNAYVASLNERGADQEQIIAEEQRVQTMLQQSARLEFEEGNYRRGINEIDAQRVAFLANIAKGQKVDQAALNAGIGVRPGTTGRPASPLGQPVVIPAETRASVSDVAATRRNLAAVQAEGGAVESEIAAREEWQRAKAREAELLQQDASATIRAATFIGATDAALTEEAVATAVLSSRLAAVPVIGGRLAGVAATAGEAASAAAVSLRGLASSIAGFLFNPLTLLLFGVPELINVIKSGDKKLAEATRDAQQEPGGIARTPTSDLARLRVDRYIAQVDAKGSGFTQFAVNVNKTLDNAQQGIVDAVDKVGRAVQPAAAPGFLNARRVSIEGAPDDALKQQADKIQKRLKDQDSFSAQFSETFSQIFNDPAGAFFGKPAVDIKSDSLKDQQKVLQDYQSERAKLFAAGKAAPYLPASVIQGQVKQSVDEFKQGLISYGQLQKDFARGIQDISLNPALTDADRRGTQAFIDDLRSRVATRVSTISADLKSLDSASLDKQISDYGEELKLFGSSSPTGRGALTHMQAILSELARRAANDPNSLAYGSKTKTNLDAFAAAQESVTSAARQQISQDLQLNLRMARTRAQRAAAYNQAAAQERALTVPIRQQIAAQARAVVALERAVAVDRAATALLPIAGQGVADAVNAVNQTINGFTGLLRPIIGKIGELPLVGGRAGKLEGDKAALKRQQDALRLLRDYQAEQDKITKDTIAGFQQQADQATKAGGPTAAQQSAPFELARLRTELAKARNAGDALAQARADQDFARQELRAAHSEKDRLQAQIDLANADHAYQQALQDRIRSQIELSQALNAGDPVRQAAIAVSGASRLLSLARGPDARIKAQTELANAQNQAFSAAQDRQQQLSEIAKAQAEGDPIRQAQIMEDLANFELRRARGEGDRLKAQLDLIQAENELSKAEEDRIAARYTYLESLTTDPVKQARLELQAARAAASYAIAHGGPETAASLEARAKVNTDRQKLIESIVSSKEDDIKFYLDMQKISTETAIEQYQALLKMHDITKAKRREILEAIKQLRDGSASEFGALDLGSIRLPTPYEIRRGLLAAQAGLNVTNHYSTSIQVTDERGAAAVGVQMDRYHSGTGKAIARVTGA